MGDHRACARVIVALLAALLLAGCGDILSGGQKEIDLYATGGGGATSTGTITGTLSIDVALRLVDEDGGVVTATPLPLSWEGPIERTDSSRVGRPRVPPRGYTTLRAVFTRVQADVTGGLQANGLPVLGFVEVDIPPGDSVVVEVEVEMAVAARARETIALDLAAGSWLPQVNPLTRRVPAEAFAGAVVVRHH